MTTKDMFLDTDNFNFFDLADITEDERAEYAPRPQEQHAPLSKIGDVGADGGIIEDASDLDSYFDEEAAEKAAEVEADPNLNLSDLANSDDAAEALDVFNDLPDDATVNFNGKALTKAQVAEAVEKIEQVEANHAFLSESAKNIDQINRFVEQRYYVNKTALEKNIEYLTRKLGSGLSDVEYGNTARQLQQAQEANEELKRDADEQFRLMDVQRQHLKEFRVNQELQINAQKVPDWERKRSIVLQDMLQNGHNLNELEKVWTPELAMMCYESYLFRKQRAKANETALARAKAKAPRSTSSAATQQRTNPQDAATAKRNEFRAAMKNGGLDERQNADLFNYLVD